MRNVLRSMMTSVTLLLMLGALKRPMASMPSSNAVR